MHPPPPPSNISLLTYVGLMLGQRRRNFVGLIIQQSLIKYVWWSYNPTETWFREKERVYPWLVCTDKVLQSGSGQISVICLCVYRAVHARMATPI